MMPNAIGSNATFSRKPPRVHVKPFAAASAGSMRFGGIELIRVEAAVRLRQNVARSGAPGKVAPMPTIAIGSRVVGMD